MKIDALLKREDFYTILEQTLNHYYKDILGLEVMVRVEDNNRSNNVVVYPKLNKIISRHPHSKIISGIHRSFNINDNPLKRLCAQAYISLLLHSGGLFATKSIWYSDISIFSPWQEICGGNKKIRINDRKNMISDVVMKSGFADDYFRSEMEFRLNHNAKYLVPIREYGDDWYRETLLDGESLARIINPTSYESSLNTAMKYLDEMIEASKEYVSGILYAKKLEQEITDNLNNIYQVKKDFTFEKKIIDEFIYKQLEKVRTIQNIPVALSHGDFQTGNVFVEKTGQVYIIDWETYKVRSIWYDAITIKLFIRRNGRWKHILENRRDTLVTDAIYSFDRERVCKVDQIIPVLLLEDLSFRLKDALMVPSDLGCEALNSFIGEVIGEKIR